MDYVAYITVIGFLNSCEWNKSNKTHKKYIAGHIGNIKIIAYNQTALKLYNNLQSMVIVSGKYLPDRQGHACFVSSVEILKEKIKAAADASIITEAENKKHIDLRSQPEFKSRHKHAERGQERPINILTGKPYGS